MITPTEADNYRKAASADALEILADEVQLLAAEMWRPEHDALKEAFNALFDNLTHRIIDLRDE